MKTILECIWILLVALIKSIFRCEIKLSKEYLDNNVHFHHEENNFFDIYVIGQYQDDFEELLKVEILDEDKYIALRINDSVFWVCDLKYIWQLQILIKLHNIRYIK